MDKIVDYFNQYPFEIGVKCFKKSSLPNSKIVRKSLSIALTSNAFQSQQEFLERFTNMVVSNFNYENSKTIYKSY